MPSSHQIRITPSTGGGVGDPNTDNLLHDLTAALQGGKAVSDFFSGNTQALNDLFQTIATGGDSVWIDGIDERSQTPTAYVDNGGRFLSVGARIDDADTLEKGTGGGAIYKQVGTAYVTLTTDQGTSLQWVGNIEYGGESIAGIAAAPALFKFLKPIVKAVASFFKNFATKMWAKIKAPFKTSDPDEATDEVAESMDEAAAGAGEEGAEVGAGVLADVTFTTVEKAGFVFAIGALAGVLILNLLSKQMTDWGKFYNATGHDIEFGICRLEGSTGAAIAPATVGQTTLVRKIGPAPAPPWVTNSDTVIYRADMQFINDNVTKGLGYVLQAKPNGDFPGFRVVVDIPALGDNSLLVGFGADDCAQVWSESSGLNAGLLASKATSGRYTLRIATNQASGKSPSPVDAVEGYNYEHLLVLTDGTVAI